MTLKCITCDENVTKTRNPGVKCVKCPNNIHRSCAQLKTGHQIWTCEGCTKGRVSLLPVPRRSVPLRPSLPAGYPSNDVASPTLISSEMSKEISDLKAVNLKILESLSSITEQLQLLVEYREENVLLRMSNRRLTAENIQLKVEIRKIECQQLQGPTNSSKSVSLSLSVSELEGNNEASNSFKTANPNRRQPLISAELNQITSNPSSSSHASLKAVQPLKFLVLANLQPHTTCEDIRTHIASKTNQQRSTIYCASLTPKSIINPHFVSFKVGVIESVFDDVMKSSCWPTNMSFREFMDNRVPNFRHRPQVSSIK